MSSLNKVFLLGNLTCTPDIRYTPSGQPVTTLRIATNESYKDKAGNLKKSVEFSNCVVWGKPAEACAKVLTKGRAVLVEGRLRTRSWDDKEGKRHWITEIISSRVQFMPRTAPAQTTRTAIGEVSTGNETLVVEEESVNVAEIVF